MRLRLALALLSLAVPACNGEADPGAGAADAGGVVMGPADAGAPGLELGPFTLTYYYVSAESEYLDAGPADTPLYLPSTCAVLVRVPMAWVRPLQIEGTGQLADGTVINYAGSCHCPTANDTTICWKPVDAAHPWGSGAQNRPLVPFRSVAVDTAVLTIGAKYWVKELAGTVMPGVGPLGGWVHDGCVVADDTGGNIIGLHIDFFAALRWFYLSIDKKLKLGSVTVFEGGARCP